MKRTIAFLLALILCAGLTGIAFASGEASGTDPTAGTVEIAGDISGYEEAVAFMQPKLTASTAENGVLDGERSAKRGEFCGLFALMMGINASDQPAEPDIAEDAWYRNAVGFLEHFAVIGAQEDGNFHPEELITREEAFCVIARFFTAFENVQLVDEEQVLELLSAYTDGMEVTQENAAAVATMLLGGVAGSSTNELRPGDAITILEVLELLYRTDAAKQAGSNFGEKDIPADVKALMSSVITLSPSGASASEEIQGMTVAALEGVVINASETGQNAVYVSGSGAEYTVERSLLSCSAESAGLNNGDNYGVGSVAAAAAGATLTIRDSVLVQNVAGSTAVTATVGGTVNLYDCALTTTDTGSRTLNTTNDSNMNLYRCRVMAAGWGALSTDVSGAGVSVYAEDSTFTVLNGRYAAYSDGGCVLTLRDCVLHSNADGLVCTGTGSAYLTDCAIIASDAEGASNYSLRVTNVQSDSTEISEIAIDGGNITNYGGPVIAIHSANADIGITDAELVSGTGVLLEVGENLWMDHPVPTTEVTGVRITMKDVEAEGDIVYSDPDRDMTVALDGTTIDGDILLGDGAGVLTVILRNGSVITGNIPEGVVLENLNG